MKQYLIGIALAAICAAPAAAATGASLPSTVDALTMPNARWQLVDPANGSVVAELVPVEQGPSTLRVIRVTRASMPQAVKTAPALASYPSGLAIWQQNLADQRALDEQFHINRFP